jgi:hypothetical protein
MVADLPRPSALPDLVREHDFAAQEGLHITTVRRWADRGWLITIKRGRIRWVDVRATLSLWRAGNRPRRGRPPKAAPPDPRQADLLE